MNLLQHIQQHCDLRDIEVLDDEEPPWHSTVTKTLHGNIPEFNEVLYLFQTEEGWIELSIHKHRWGSVARLHDWDEDLDLLIQRATAACRAGWEAGGKIMEDEEIREAFQMVEDLRKFRSDKARMRPGNWRGQTGDT